MSEVYSRGAYPQVLLVDERFDEAALRHAPSKIVSWVPEIEAYAMEWADVHIALRGMVPPWRHGDEGSAELAAQRAAKGRISTLRWESTRWCIVRVPTTRWAKHFNIPTRKIHAEFFDGCLLNWDSARSEWTALARKLEGARTINICGYETDLTLDVAGRSWILFAGEANMPDGEMAISPNEYQVNGTIKFDDRMVFAGTLMEGLKVSFEAGRVVHVSAEKGASTATALLAADDGASRVGEFGFGLNPHMRTLTGDLFIDEKILGTVHIAFGRAYPESGGTNKSSIHWDVVKDLRPRSGRPGGRLTVDGAVLMEDGKPTDGWSFGQP